MIRWWALGLGWLHKNRDAAAAEPLADTLQQEVRHNQQCLEQHRACLLVDNSQKRSEATCQKTSTNKWTD